MPEITGLLLAAGNSSRFGSHKLLTEIQGRPLILHSADCLIACDRLIAVVRVEDKPLRRLLQKTRIETVINHQTDQGMGSSLASGIKASFTSEAWCILPADMPYIDRTTSQQIVQALRKGADIAAPYYQGRRGHPVGFSQAYRDRLLALQGDVGAREILARERQSVVKILVKDAGILRDIDTPQDLKIQP